MTGWRGPILAMLLMALITCAAAVIAVPHVLMNIAIARLSSASGLNVMSHGPLATPERQPVVRPSPDLAYSACPYSLDGGPLLLTIHPVDGRYSSLSIFDGRTDVIFVRNDMQAKGAPYRLVVARPGQSVPAGIEVVRSESAKGIALIRLLLTAPTELPELEAQRRKSSCRTLSDMALK